MNLPEPVLVTNTGTIGVPGKDFRAAVAVHGDWAACAAPFGEALAEVFQYREGEWRFHARLAAPGLMPTEWLPAMAMNRQRLWVAVPHAGRVVVFRRRGAAWNYEDALMAPEGWRDSTFGERLFLDGDTLCVNGWTARRCGTIVYPAGERLVNPEESVAHTVCVHGSYLFIATGYSRWAGDVNWMCLKEGRWQHAGSLDAGPAAEASSFAAAVAMHGERLLVTARFRPRKAAAAAHWYRRRGAAWNWESTLTLPDFEGTHRVVFGDNLAAVAFPHAVNGEGRVCLLIEDAGAWRLAHVLTAPDPQPGGRFGDSLSCDGHHLMIGSPGAVQGGGCGFLYRIAGEA